MGGSRPEDLGPHVYREVHALGTERLSIAIDRAVADAPRGYRLLSVVPTMISYFATAPERYETRDVLLVFERMR